MQVNVLPVKQELGYPHYVKVVLEGALYKITYRFNYIDEKTLIVRLDRVEDNQLVFIEQMPVGSVFPVRDPTTKESLFYICVLAINDHIEIVTIPLEEAL